MHSNGVVLLRDVLKLRFFMWLSENILPLEIVSVLSIECKDEYNIHSFFIVCYVLTDKIVVNSSLASSIHLQHKQTPLLS